MDPRSLRYTVGYGPKPRDIDDINMTLPKVNETAESEKETWKRMMKAATQKEDFRKYKAIFVW